MTVCFSLTTLYRVVTESTPLFLPAIAPRAGLCISKSKGNDRKNARTSPNSRQDTSRAASSSLMIPSLISACVGILITAFSSSLTSSSIRMTLPPFFSSRSRCVFTPPRFFSATPASCTARSCHGALAQCPARARQSDLPFVKPWHDNPSIRVCARSICVRRSCCSVAFWYCIKAQHSFWSVSNLGVISSASSTVITSTRFSFFPSSWPCLSVLQTCASQWLLQPYRDFF